MIIKYIKKNYKSILFIFIYSILAYSLYFNAHYVHDSYRIYNFGFWTNLDGFFRQGRVFSMFFNMLFYALHISPRIGQIISMILVIIFLEISILIIYNLLLKRLEKQYNNKNFRFLLLIICTTVFFNIYITEWMMFLESTIIALGTLLSIISAYFVIEKKGVIKKYIISTIFMILSVFCYQASMIIGGTFIVIFLIYDNKEQKILYIIKEVLLGMLPYIFALIVNFIFIKIVNMNNLSDGRLAGSINIFSNIFFIVKQIYWYGIKMFNYPFNYFISALGIICIGYFIYIILKKEKSKIKLLYYLVCIFSLWFLSVLPVIVMPTGSQYFVARSVPYMASVLPISLICGILFSNINFDTNKKIKFVVILYSIVIVISCIKITSECLKNNAQDIATAKWIQNEITEYENNTGNKIEKIVLVPDSKITPNNKGIKYYGDNSVRAMCNDFSLKEIMYFVSQRYYTIENGTVEDKNNIFGNNEWDEFSIEQLKFKEDILYLVNY